METMSWSSESVRRNIKPKYWKYSDTQGANIPKERIQPSSQDDEN